jgi:hypothetical protein
MVLPEVPRRELRSEELASLEAAASRVDAALGEAVQDLGFTLEVGEPAGTGRVRVNEEALVARAGTEWVVAPSIELMRSHYRVRITALAPGSKVLLVRFAQLDAEELEVESMRMLRELVNAAVPAAPAQEPAAPSSGVRVVRTRSAGRAVLALNAAVLGGFTGYAVQRASGSQDERLVFPLTALGTGIGLGASMIVADEWDVGVGPAWYLSAGALWGGASGLLLARGYEPHAKDKRPTTGVVGAVTGVSFATLSLALRTVDEGGAALAHSGGAFGVLFGALGEAFVNGQTDATPHRGMGWGAGAGVFAAGLAAQYVKPAPSRVLFVDLAAGLGGLTGAAAASPLVFGDATTEAENRLWLSGVALGTVTGGVVGMVLTRHEAHASTARADSRSTARARPSVAPYMTPLSAVHGVTPMSFGVSGSF